MSRCDQCRFFHPHPPASERGEIVVATDGIWGGGECRAQPPVIVDHNTFASFPIVWNDGWCGRFERQPAGAPQALEA